jgi:hypothetical protein
MQTSRLVFKGTQNVCPVGHILKTADGSEVYTVQGHQPPRTGNSSGRVYVTDAFANTREFFPHVFDLEIIADPPGRRFSASFTGGGIVILKPLDPEPVTLAKLNEHRDDVSRAWRLVFHSNGPCMMSFGPRGGVKTYSEEGRANGAVKTWKTRPDDFRVPTKYGIGNHYGEVTHVNGKCYHFADECPLTLLPKTRDEVLTLLANHGLTNQTYFEFVLTDEEVTQHG